jgi:hypothetical protein
VIPDGRGTEGVGDLVDFGLHIAVMRDLQCIGRRML